MGKIKDYDEKLNADDSDVFIIEDATATKFTKFISLYNSIKLKLGLGTAATKDIESDLDSAVDGNPADVSICKNLKSQIDTLNSEKAPKSHSSSGTEYGLASNTQYGHAKRSNTLPKVAGTANTGSENSTFAAGDHVHPLQTTVSGSSGSCTGNATTASSLQNTRYVDGVGFKGDSNIHHYGVCTTSASTAAKTVSISGFSLLTGSRAIVKFTYGNTVASPTLNISSTGVKAIYYKGATVPSGLITANSFVELVYDGTQYNVVGELEQVVTDITSSFTPSTDKISITKAYKYGKLVIVHGFLMAGYAQGWHTTETITTSYPPLTNASFIMGSQNSGDQTTGIKLDYRPSGAVYGTVSAELSGNNLFQLIYFIA
ncbi:hypothetical protein GKG47_11955 [Lactonifactor sp. BIOML-A3]|uniref:hypothetical protein n=1 Tax=unclassified Lactonifactor TaxID=2636670 RepID=UPI0012B023C1|nr:MULTISPECIES: hypothetical protein [unclassified Lactonifactor]MSA01026.1 hypothetical protein [Lactonifactor sp. BIOML-A5]MSA10328.1 hypothetical protein [Lactonifactor sp. BIOML-A4]MSA13138.1 hypothetical protein [Lactonifactor sp. BIOML-A3]MSA19300.1 hypothetical protein [Lactonifactor sp. BIOML-A2]MSA38377.1 hypothetical protein [Lactonifactor sp. BIOML-A1]